MSSTLWGKFYWSDYASDEALKMCGLSAQGLWMRMLCTMAGSEPYGYLTINGHSLNKDDLVKLYATGQAEIDDAVAELDRYGVFSRDAKGRIYSRRMVRDVKKAAVARKNGKHGGNPNLSKQRENQSSDNQQDKATVKRQIPDTRDHIPERKKEGGADAQPMAFVGKVVRLSFDDFDSWKKTYHAVPDIRAELEAIDAYYAERPPKDGKWFFPASNWLKKAHNDAQTKADEARRDVGIQGFSR